MVKETHGLAYQIYDDITNEHVANIYYDEHTDKYRAELLVKENSPYLFNTFIQEEGRFGIGERPNPNSKYILYFLQDRVIPENRDMLKEILEANGLYEYDWRVLIRINHGRVTDDDFRVEAV